MQLEQVNFFVIEYPQADTAEAALAAVRNLEKEEVVESVPEELECLRTPRSGIEDWLSNR